MQCPTCGTELETDSPCPTCDEACPQGKISRWSTAAFIVALSPWFVSPILLAVFSAIFKSDERPFSSTHILWTFGAVAVIDVTAVLLASIAISRIRRSGGADRGRGIAIAALVMGILFGLLHTIIFWFLKGLEELQF